MIKEVIQKEYKQEYHESSLKLQWKQQRQVNIKYTKPNEKSGLLAPVRKHS